MSAHTPGPWIYTKTILDDGDVVFEIRQGDDAARTPYFSDVAYCRVFKTYASECAHVQEANARLLAAAPDLLEALSVLSEWVGGLIFDADGRKLENARAAIAKATGGEA